MERKTIKKWFWVWEFEKEERWLNEMALQGWVLERVGFCKYEFVACQPGEYCVRLELRDYDEKYIAFMQELGAEYIGRMVKWIYFRRRTEEGPFDLFSDIDSRIAHLNRIGKMLMVVSGANLIVGLNPANRISWLNLLGCAVLAYALGRIHSKRETLEAERMLHE